MTPADRVLLLCARQAFLDDHREAVEQLAAEHAIRWPQLLATAEAHGVLPIVGANLRRCDPRRIGLQEPIRERLELAVLENAAAREREAHSLASSLARLRESELDAMLLKSSALALGVYEEPWVVASNDVDLALRPQPGWRKGKGVERRLRLELYTSGVECDLDGHHDVTLDGVLPIDFDRIWREARQLSFRGVPAWTMSPEDQLVALCVNACRKRFFRLKSLFDLAETLRRGERIDPARLARLARSGRCEGIVHSALVATRDALGAPLPPGLLEALALPKARARLIDGLVRACLRHSAMGRPGHHLLTALLVLASVRATVALRAIALTPRQRVRSRRKRRRLGLEGSLAPAR